jgi:hypothetical protein
MIERDSGLQTGTFFHYAVSYKLAYFGFKPNIALHLPMLLRFFRLIVQTLKSLPLIKDVPGFNSLPPKITPLYLRFYKLCNLVLTLGMFVHLLWVFVFMYMELHAMAFINIISFFLYVFCIVINRRGYHLTSVGMMVCEIIFHQIIAVHMIGWDAGFQYYMIVIAIFPFLMPQGNWTLKSILLFICLCAYILMDYFLKERLPNHSLNPSFITFFSISNIVFSFVSLAISGGYFNIAMHETEVKLEQKTIELVAAEQIATQGKIATEMAHEIQNPLNFVNNFSALNADLLKELETELDANSQSQQVKELLFDLIQNSERIQANGKRVSAIVKSLNDQMM